MTDKIDSDQVIPKSALNVQQEAEIERKIRVYTKVGSTAVALVVIIGTFFFCCYAIVNVPASASQAWSALLGIVGAMVGFLYGKSVS